MGGLRNFPNPWLDCAHKHIHTSSIDKHCVRVQEYRMVLQDNRTIIETKIFNLCLLYVHVPRMRGIYYNMEFLPPPQ